MDKAYTQHPPQQSPRSRTSYSRQQIADFLEQRQQAAQQGLSQRAFAHHHALPRTTLQHWESGDERGRSALHEVLNSPLGLHFLHRLVIAAHLVFTKCGPCGVPLLSTFLKLSGLDQFVASSYGSQYKTSVAMDKALLIFGEEEDQRLSIGQPRKLISLLEDETFHPEILLVAMDAVSGFLILEEYAQDRSAKTWHERVEEGLAGYNVEVVQVVGDQAKGLMCHAEKCLGVHYSVDLFHPEQEAARAVFPTLARQEKTAQEDLGKAQAALENETDGRRLRRLRREQHEAREEFEAIAQRRAEAREELRGISKAYHPFDLETGAERSADQVEREIVEHFDKLKQIAKQASVSKKSLERLAKARRAVSNFKATIAFVLGLIAARLQALSLPTELEEIMRRHLIPGLYLRRCAERSAQADVRDTLFERSKKLLGVTRARDGPWAELAEERREELLREAQLCADLFQRSSSAVEGRNGQQSLRHHSVHRLSTRKIGAQKVLHNYFLTRKDETTAAERFFEQKPRNLFEYLVAKLPFPARPRNKRRASPNIEDDAS